MSAVELMARLKSLGIGIVADDGRLRVSASRGQLTEELKEAISAEKAELLTLLAARAPQRSADLFPVPRDQAMPLSLFQERLWVLSRLEPESTAFNMVAVWPSGEPVDIARLTSAIATVVRRHEILRATFRAEGGAAFVHLVPPDSVPIEVYDLSDRTDDEQWKVIRTATDEAKAAPFDLTTQPPVRFAVYRLAANRTATLVALHHIAVDVWSVDLLAGEVVAAYEGAAGHAPGLQYADYAAWQRRTQDTEAIASDLDWWAQRLAGTPQFSMFPADGPPSGKAPGAAHDFRWDHELSEGIRAMAREEGATVYMALLATCAAVLHWHTGQNDIVLGSPMGMRERPEFESMIGPFVNLLVMRLDLSDDPPFAELLRRSRDAVLDAHAHRQVPFERLLERLRPARSLDHSPLFQVALVQHNAPDTRATPIHSGGAIHELTWFVRDVAGRLEGSIEYRSDLYLAETVDRIATHLETTLSAAVQDRHRRVSELLVLTPIERRRVVEQYNATAVATDPGTVVARFERQAALTPAAWAVRFEGAVLTYGELNRRANQLAHHLRTLGVAPGALVALCVPRSLDVVVALLGIQKSGGAYVPLDPGFPVERLDFMLADSGAMMLVTADGAAAGVDVPEGVRVLDLGSQAAALAKLSPANLEDAAGPQDPAYVIYTSGSTGRPKGVVVSHGGLANFLASMEREPGLSAADVLAAVTTISFDIAGLELYLPLMVGARVELLSQETATDGPTLAAQLAACGATALQATPATWRLLLEAGWAGCPTLRALCGGEALPRDLADALLARTQELWNLYGPTETTIWSTVERVERDGGPITIGRPIANTQVYVLDRQGEPVPIGVSGELWIGGAGVALGYHGRPELTAERFVPDHLGRVAGGRIYRTGDLGRWRADGRLEHLGRLDTQVKIRGFRIELGEIEAALQRHPHVRQAVVEARTYAPGDTRLVGFVVAESGAAPNSNELRNFLRSTLPEYMIPWQFVLLSAVPLTPNGKVDRKALPAPNVAPQGAAALAPRTPLEETLAHIWADVLRIERVGVEDNFFDLGGHSLLVMQVVSRVERALEVLMPIRIFFEFPTIAALAIEVERRRSQEHAARPRVEITAASRSAHRVRTAVLDSPAGKEVTR